MTDALVALLTSLADDELVIGHRHSEWTGFAPHIEEDVAFSSIAQDEIGHAAALYALAARLTDSDADRLAFGRDPMEYRHAVLCERPNGDWSYTLARHWLYELAESLRLESLCSSTYPELAALAVKLQREERYHLLHADAWIKRIANGPLEGRTKVVDAMAEALAEAPGLFERFGGEEQALAQGWLPEASPELLERFLRRAVGALDELGLPTGVFGHEDEAAEFVASSSGDLLAARSEPSQAWGARADSLGGRAGRHSKDFTGLWEEMTSTYRASPGASW